MAVIMQGNGLALTLADRVRRRKNAMWTARSPIDTRAKLVRDYVYPQGGRWTPTDRDTEPTNWGLTINNTTWRARRTISSGLMAGMTSPARPWFRLALRDNDLNRHDAARKWLHDCAELMRSIFTRSGTYRMLHGLYDELVTFGTAADIVYNDYDTVICHAPLTFGEYAVATDKKGRPNALARERQFTVWEVVEEFGIDAVSTQVADQYRRLNFDHAVPVIHLIQPRPVRDTGNPSAKHMPFESVHVEARGPNNAVLRNSGFKTFRVLAPRWGAVPGATYGTGVGSEVLGDAIHLQFLEQAKAKVIDYQSDPPLQLPASLKGKEADLLPGGHTYYDQTTAHGGVRPAFEVQWNEKGLREEIMQTEERINASFYVDLFLMLQQEGIRSGVTAREIVERHEEKLLMLGPVLESLHDELLAPLVEIVFERMVEVGMVPPAPPELEDAELKIEFVSTLAQAQRAVGLQSVDRLLGTVGNLALQKPDVWDKIDTDKVIDIYGDMLGVDPDLIVATEKLEDIRSARAQQAAAQQTLAAAGEMAKGAKDFSQADTDGQNALTDILSFSGR